MKNYNSNKVEQKLSFIFPFKSKENNTISYNSTRNAKVSFIGPVLLLSSRYPSYLYYFAQGHSTKVSFVVKESLINSKNKLHLKITALRTLVKQIDFSQEYMYPTISVAIILCPGLCEGLFQGVQSS